MKQPVKPQKEDCCNSGCNPCIFDVYEKQLRLYESNVECGENSKTNVENAMSQLEYSPFHVVKNIDICKGHRLVIFKRVESVANKYVFWNPGEHILVKYSVAKHSCTRAYTPMKIELKMEDDYDFAVIVKRYNNGLVSNYLCDLNVGENTLWRGPYGHYQLDSEKFSRIVMVAQGTGIASLFSIIKHVLNDENNMTRIILFYCCELINTILLRDQLYTLKSYWNFDYVIHISKKSEKCFFKYKEPIKMERLTLGDLFNLKPFIETDQFLLCGSDVFMKHYRKCLIDQNIESKNIVTF